MGPIAVREGTHEALETWAICASATEIWLGKLPAGDTWNNQYKSVIAHELGHLAQRAWFGLPSSPGATASGDYSDKASDWIFCGCCDRQHCLGSREYLASAFTEAYAHYFAARTLNVPNQSDAIFPYYKRVLKPRAQNHNCHQGGSCSVWTPPVAHDVLNPHRWLETQCPGDAIAHRATEMDWLGLLYDLGAKNGYTGADLASIATHEEMCDGWCDDSDEMTWNKMRNSVQAQGFPFSKAKRFDERSITFGVQR